MHFTFSLPLPQLTGDLSPLQDLTTFNSVLILDGNEVCVSRFYFSVSFVFVGDVSFCFNQFEGTLEPIAKLTKLPRLALQNNFVRYH
jgi:hypothetical protein